MKDWYFKRQLQSSDVCADLYSTRISDFVFHRRRCRFPNSLLSSQLDPAGGMISDRSEHFASRSHVNVYYN